MARVANTLGMAECSPLYSLEHEKLYMGYASYELK